MRIEAITKWLKVMVKGVLPFYLFTFLPLGARAQVDISYAGTPRTCEIGGITVEGVEGYEDYVLTGLSGLQVGQQIETIVDVIEEVFGMTLVSAVIKQGSRTLVTTEMKIALKED